MFPWAAIVGLAGQAVSGIASALNNKRMQQSADAEAARQEAFYKAQASQNPIARSENQALLGQYDRDAKKQVETARNVAAITGATPEYSAAVQKAVADGRANLMSNMSAGASRRADYYNTLGEETRHRKALEDQQRRAERNMTYANLAANAASAAGSIMDAYTAKAPAAEPEGYQGPVISSKDQQKINTSLGAFGEEMKQQHGLYNLPMGGRYVNGVRLPE